MTVNEYLTGLTLFFIGYISLEVVCAFTTLFPFGGSLLKLYAGNIVLKRIGPKIWLPLITFVWGVVATLQGVVQNNGGKSGMIGFFLVRFFLGVTEGGLFPGVVFYLR